MCKKIRKTRSTVYKTLQGLAKQLAYKQIDGEMMAEHRACFGRLYCCQNFKVTQEVEDEFWNGMAKIVWDNPSERQVKCLRYADTWMLRRLMYSNGRFHYCAGQDYPSEIIRIQECVNKWV